MTRPDDEKNRGGRPPHVPTDETRRRVTICAGSGMLHEEIGLAIGISQPTLRKHYEFELSHGAYSRRAEVLEALHAAAVKGNASAARAFLTLTPAAAVPPPDPEQPKAPALGKKEQANVDAKTAQTGTSWDHLLPRTTTAQ